MDSKTSVPRDTGLKTEAVREPECLVVLHSGKKGRGFVGGWFKGGSSRSAVGTLKWPGSGASLPFPPLFPCTRSSAKVTGDIDDLGYAYYLVAGWVGLR